MNTQLADDREYRRGMILGLTLAEVLLLLLFLLMLALGSELIDLQDKLASAKDGSAASENAGLKTELNAALGKLSAYELLFPDIAIAGKVKAALDAAAEINPADPPAALKTGVDLQIALGRDLSAGATDIAGMATEMSALRSENADLKTRLTQVEPLRDVLARLGKSEAGQDDAKLKALADLIETLAELFESQHGRPPTSRELQDFVEANLANFRGDASKWPPIISLSEANHHYFQTGSAALTPAFRDTLETAIPAKLLELLQHYEVDTIEVIGHTDEQPIRGRISNLDDTLLPALKGAHAGDALTASDNSGLGMARAVTVMQVLRSDPRLAEWEIIPLSGGQLIESDGKLSHGAGGDVRERRRIEIRLRGSGGVVGELAPR